MNKLKPILSLLLVGVLIFSSLGFSVSRHYCKGILVGESFYELNSSCNGSGENNSCESSCSSQISCCAEEQLSIAGIEVLRSVDDDGHIDLSYPAFTQARIFSVLAQPEVKLSYKLPPPAPPESSREILIHIQRFII